MCLRKKKKKLKSLIGFLSAKKKKINNYNGWGRGKGENKTKQNFKRVYRASQKIRRTNVFLESQHPSHTGSHSLPYIPMMPSNTVLISGPAVGAAQILIWSYSCVFLPPISTAIRANVFSFVEALNVFLYSP